MHIVDWFADPSFVGSSSLAVHCYPYSVKTKDRAVGMVKVVGCPTPDVVGSDGLVSLYAEITELWTRWGRIGQRRTVPNPVHPSLAPRVLGDKAEHGPIGESWWWSRPVDPQGNDRVCRCRSDELELQQAPKMWTGKGLAIGIGCGAFVGTEINCDVSSIEGATVVTHHRTQKFAPRNRLEK
jgi:hypothetical protein